MSEKVDEASRKPRTKKSNLYEVLEGPPITGLLDGDNINVNEINTDQVGTNLNYAEEYVVERIVDLGVEEVRTLYCVHWDEYLANNKTVEPA